MPHRIKSEIAKDPAIMGGIACIVGTRIPAHLIAALVRQGATDEEILDDYPALNHADIRVALEYAEEHPEDDY